MYRIIMIIFAVSFCMGPLMAEKSLTGSFKQIEAKAEIVSSSNMAIHTYGGGELLERVFNAVSMLIYGNSTSGLAKTFQGIIRLAMLIGSFACIIMAFTKGSLGPIINKFFFPALGIVTLLVPRTTVYIKDHLAQTVSSVNMPALRKVENVPFFMGHVTTWMSELSYLLTQGLETVSHGVNDTVYNWTGHIFAGNDLLTARRCRIANPTLEDNFREFCRECAFRDIGIGLYTKDDLIHTKDLLQFLESRTSNLRTVMYKEIGSDEHSTLKGNYIPCKEAMKKMNALFNKQEGDARIIVLGETSSDLGLLLGQKKFGEKDLDNLIKQQAAIGLIKEELPGGIGSFAVKRAELQQQTSQKILGALGARSIVAMRNFFEATIYMVFPLMVIVSLLSFGIKPLLSWLQFGLWINMWPIFYIIVNFLLTSVWNFRKKLISGSSLDLTIFTSEGLVDLYSSMEAMAAMALSLIPFLSWVLLKGGVSQMVHMTSSLTGPAQSAAGSAAAEQVTGNYSYGNVGLSNTNAHNVQEFKQSYSGMLSHGSVGINSGSQTMTHASDTGQTFVRQSDSYLREGISRSEAFSRSLQESLTSSESAVLDSSTSVSSSINDSSNKAVGLVEAISKHAQSGESFSIQDSSGAQQALSGMYNTAQEYSNATGLSMDSAVKEMASLGVNSGIVGQMIGVKGGLEGSGQKGVSDFENYSELTKAMESNQFQEHLQTIRNLSSSEVSSLLGSEDAKYHEDFVQSLNQVESSSEQLRSAYSKQSALSDLQSYSESESVTFHQNLNQQFVDFLSDKYQGDTSQIASALNTPNDKIGKQALVHEFVDGYLPSMIEEGPPTYIKDLHEQQTASISSSVGANFESSHSRLKQEGIDRVGHDFSQIESQSLENRVSSSLQKDQATISNESDHILNLKEHYSEPAQAKLEKGLLLNAKDHLNASKAISKSEELYQSWFSQEDNN